MTPKTTARTAALAGQGRWRPKCSAVRRPRTDPRPPAAAPRPSVAAGTTARLMLVTLPLGDAHFGDEEREGCRPDLFAVEYRHAV